MKIWVVHSHCGYSGEIVDPDGIDIEIFRTEEEAHKYFKREMYEFEKFYDGPSADDIMPPDVKDRSFEECIEQMEYEAEYEPGWIVAEQIEAEENSQAVEEIKRRYRDG